MPAGRPTDLTPQILEDIKRLLPVVLYIETVADYLGKDRTTIGKWLRRGSKEHKRLARSRRAKPLKSEAGCLQFFLTYKMALADGEYQDAEKIKQAAEKQWTAAAWRLERRFPERWSSERGLLLKLVRESQENRDELAKLRAEVATGNPPATGRIEGAPPSTEERRTTGEAAP